MMESINFLQLNVNRSRTSHELLAAAAATNRAHVIMISEPNLALAKKKGWLLDDSGGAAICLSSQLKIEKQGRGNGYVFIETKKHLIISCYFSPNVDSVFEAGIVEMEEMVRTSRKSVIIAGDLNARHLRWNPGPGNPRGDELAEFIDVLELVVHNDTTPTWQRREQSSVLDLTITSASIAAQVKDWKVYEDEEMYSDHQLIGFRLVPEDIEQPTPRHRWIYRPERKEKVEAALAQAVATNPCDTPADLNRIVEQACAASLKLAGPRNSKREIFWWNPEIAMCKREASRSKRNLQRERRRGGIRYEGEERIEELQKCLQTTKDDLRKAITASRNRKWDQICEELEMNPWGDAYKIVRDKMARQNPIPQDLRRACIAKLFPERPPFVIQRNRTAQVVPLLDGSELQAAADRLKVKKSPGPDGVPPEVIKLMAKQHPVEMLQAYNFALKEGVFPDDWKKALLVLLPKPGKPLNDPSGLRPLCLLNISGKLFESMLLARLQQHLNKEKGISDNQFGFRKGRSTIAAIKRVMKRVNSAAAGTHRTRKVPAVVMLDVANAFNTARWDIISRCLEELKVPEYLLAVLRDYMSERVLVSEGEQHRLSCGVPQGSVLGPTLWNVLYDRVLRCGMPPGVDRVAFADDLALVIVGATVRDVNQAGNDAIRRIILILSELGLELAPQKTEVVVMAGRRELDPVNISVAGHVVAVKEAAKYLGVWLHKNRSFTEHVRQATMKAANVAGALTKLMANTRGPGAGKRRVIATAAESAALYAAPVWIAAMAQANCRDMLTRAQRPLVLKVCSAYRTVSTEAAQVIAGMPPWDLRAQARAERSRRVAEDDVKKNLAERWQARWESGGKGAWTRQLIPRIAPWLERSHGQVNHWTTQLLSGHGPFNEFLYRRGRRSSPHCPFCPDQIDTAEHTIFHCGKWDNERRKVWGEFGIQTPSTIVATMMQSTEAWEAVSTTVSVILKARCKENS